MRKKRKVRKPWLEVSSEEVNEMTREDVTNNADLDRQDEDEDSADAMSIEMQQGMEELRESASALFRIPVFFSHQNLFRLGPNERQFIIRMFREIKRELLFPRTLPNTEQYPQTTLENIRRVVKSSYGTVAVLLQQTGPTADNEQYSPFLQVEPAMAYQYGHPLLLVIQRKRQGDNLPTLPQAGGVWKFSPFGPVEWFSDDVTVDQFFESPQWREVLKMWAGQVRSGYFIQTEPEYQYRCDD